MANRLLFFILVLCFSTIESQNSLEDKYSGVFRHGNFSTDIIIDIHQKNDLNQVFFSSPEQNAYGIPAREVAIESDSIAFVLQSDFFRYEFKGEFQGDSLNMNLSIEKNVYPFVLIKSSAFQEEQFSSRDIRFRSGNLLLYGTLYLPEKPNGKAIYLVTSSGNQDRSASRAEAQFLARQGYITLHADKRGTGLSDGNWQEAGIPELCMDDIQAINYLSEINNLNYSNIGIKGSSQGASKVPYILSKMPELGFGIVVSCPASTLLDSDLNYWKNRTRKELSEDELNQAAEIQRSVFLFIAGEIPREELGNQIERIRNETWMSEVWVPELDSVRTDQKLNYTPMPFFEQLKKPILVIQGSSDEIIPSHSLKTIQGLTENNNPRNRYVELKNADHSMMLQGESDFPYWPALHPSYRSEMLKWLNQLELSGK
jgi:alpha-beta hydrolase superfamily lysophospholipase